MMKSVQRKQQSTYIETNKWATVEFPKTSLPGGGHPLPIPHPVAILRLEPFSCTNHHYGLDGQNLVSVFQSRHTTYLKTVLGSQSKSFRDEVNENSEGIHP